MSVELTQHGTTARLVLNRPDALNALSFDILAQIGQALDDVARMKDVRCLFISGAGDRAFCAGADIPELRDRSLIDQQRGAELGQRVFAKLADLPMTSVALINGFAFGGGLELALGCTFRLAAPTARMGLPEIKLGLIPGYGGTQRLPRLIGQTRALEMILTGRTVEAPEALSMGLVDRICDGDLWEAGDAFSQTFTGYGMMAQYLARQAVERGSDLPLDQGLKLEAQLSTLAYRTEDAEEGMQAFVEKRKPRFRDV